ncbi:acetate--CoA ligase family protein [Amycolatopsis rhabdoformis]|uniref:Acetate--CoA ligase family protein n=1 Tax=Amycolatopsis rhabdoformis TaxID=1448059 RepID=A0ABZ1IJ54_9PSEU|nr:acetate--CoA ligase family protein [Amycolatopsis rhabdoformis]WSE34485.1 acetate--CoA ligase family protein [Amycolatopsis rhabdoformis]
MSVPNAFLDPASIAVVGATDDRAKWGYWLATGALRGAHRRTVWLVNRQARPLFGHPSHPSLDALPEAPELVVLCVPAQQVKPVVAQALARGTRALLAITAGLGADEAELDLMLRAAGARLLGPNSLGLYDAGADLQLAWGTFTPGPLAIVSQSGQLGLEIATLAARSGLGVSRFYSVGNQLGVTAADLLEALVEDERTTTVALYLEGFTEGPRVMAALRALRRAGKPTLVLSTGASDGSRRLARSHTGSLTSAVDVVEAACRTAGALRVATVRDLVGTARYLSSVAPPRGRRLAIVSDSGGQGGLAADVAASFGLSTPVFSPELRRKLGDLLPVGAALANPVDLAGAGEADLTVYAAVSEVIAASGEADAIVLSGYFGCYGEDAPVLVEAEHAVVDRLGHLAGGDVPLVVHSMSDRSAAVERMARRRLPAYAAIESALGALAHAASLGPGREPAVANQAASRPATGYWAARETLAALGIPVPGAVRVGDAAEVAGQFARLRAPVVLKAGWLEHKSEHGGIRAGLADADAVSLAFEEMSARLGPGEYVLEEQDTRAGVVEMLVGARRDRDFGPTITVGFGGVEAELWRDARVELAPVDRATALAMLDALRCRPLLAGWRGKPAVDVGALADVVVAVSEALARDPGLTDLEINPIRVAAGGVLAVDALIVHEATTEKEQPCPR